MDLKRMHAAVAAYAEGADERDVARLRFFERVLELQQRRADELAARHAGDGMPCELPEGTDVAGLYRRQESVFSQAPVAIDPAELAETLAAVAGCIADGAGLSPQASAGLRAVGWGALAAGLDMRQAGSDPAGFIDDVLMRADGLGVSTQVPLGVLASVLQLSLRPHLQPAAEWVARQCRQDRETPPASASLDCPVCGAPAAASWVGESAGTDGRGRVQYCATCGTQWGFERIRCTNCGTRNEGHLHYHSVAGDPAHRIQTCDECGGYSRVVFREDLEKGPFVMEVEDVVMANLDQIANDPRLREQLLDSKRV